MNKRKFKLPEEWLKQAAYDLDTAKAMFGTRKYIYTVFMCHLCVEKILKGVYAKNFQKNPLKTHDLNYLCEEIGLVLPGKLQHFLDRLNDLSVPVRYPDELERLLKDYKKNKTEKVLRQTEELFTWIKKKF